MQSDCRSSFNELMDTPVDFSNFLMNRLKVDTLTPKLLAGPIYKLMKGSCKSLVELEYQLKEVYKATTDQLDWVNPKGASSRKYTTSVTKTKAADYGHIKWIKDLMPRTMWIHEPIGYDKHALWGVSHWGHKRQRFYGFAVNRESACDVYSKHRIITVTELKIVEWHNYKHLDWITMRQDDDKLYKFKEGDFKRLCIQDIKDMLLLLVQGKLTNLTVKERFAFNKKLNLTMSDTYRFDLKHKEAYIAYSNLRGFIYQNKDKQKRLMQINELHKFSDGTLTDVRTALDDRCGVLDRGREVLVLLGGEVFDRTSSSLATRTLILSISIVQATKLRKQADIQEGKDKSVLSTQEYIRKVVEDVGEDEDFKGESWVSAVEFVNANEGIVNGCLGDIKNYFKNGKLDHKKNSLISSLTFVYEAHGVPSANSDGKPPIGGSFENLPQGAHPMYAFPNMPAYANPNLTGLFPNLLGPLTPFVRWIEDYPLPDGLKMPSHIGFYDRKGDPDNFLHLFEGAIRMRKWLMLVACHMFTYTLKVFARIWWNSQKADLPATYKGLMEKMYTWVEAREVATNGVSNDQRDSFERPKKSSWNNNKGQMGRSRSFSYKGESHKLLSNSAKSSREIFTTERRKLVRSNIRTLLPKVETVNQISSSGLQYSPRGVFGRRVVVVRRNTIRSHNRIRSPHDHEDTYIRNRKRIIEKVFGSQIGRNMEVTADDMVIKSDFKEEMLADIEETFKRPHAINLKLKPRKCSFGVEEGIYFGHLVTKQGIKADPSKIPLEKHRECPSFHENPKKLHEWKDGSVDNRSKRSLSKNERMLRVTANNGYTNQRSMADVSKSKGKRIHVRIGYYWPSMHKDAKDLIRKYEACQIYSSILRKPKQEMKSIMSPWPFLQRGIDIIGPIPAMPGGARFLVVAIDYFTKWVEAKTLISITGRHMEKFIWEHIVCRFGRPQIIISDNRKQFAESTFPIFYKKLKAIQAFTSVYHPQANGQVEVTNREIIKGME
nr:rve domain-containing protein/RVT_3 domain-containing protein [Tanacetum cinerariifolium]